MNDELIVAIDPKTHRLAKHRFVLLIIGTIGIALLLVVIAMIMYLTSGAAQVDLSRPGYVSVREQAQKSDDELKTFPATGQIDSKALDEFDVLYKKELDQIKTEVFRPDVLSDETLSIQSNDPAQ